MTGKQNRGMLLLILVLSVVAATLTFRTNVFGMHLPAFRTGLDIQGGARVVLRAKTEAYKGKWDPNTNLEAVRKVLENRVNATGVSEPQIITKPPDRIIIELPGLKDEAEVREQLKSTASLQFYLLPQMGKKDGSAPVRWFQDEYKDPKTGVTGPALVDAQSHLPVPQQVLQEEIFSTEPIASGGDLGSSTAEPSPATGQAVIHFSLKGTAREKFQEITRNNIGRHLAIFLDNRLLTAPVIEGILPGEGEITGNFTLVSAKALSDQLNAGALPVPLEEVEVRKLEATLGAEAVHATFLAGCLGLGLVLFFMVVWYKLPGVLADVALVLYTLFSLALFKAWPITLTLPGIAGFILSIGMAVDANILIFERFKEELRSGKTLRAAIDAGFKRAWTAIFDSNVCTMVTCSILYLFGTGPIRGFALTLGLGVLVSMFTAILVTRTFLFALVSTNLGENPRAFGIAGEDRVRSLRVMSNKWLWLGISLAIIIPGLLAWAGGGIKQSIDFKGGTEQQIPFASRHSASDIAGVVSSLGSKFKDNRVVVSEDPSQTFKHFATVTTERLEEPDRIKLLQTLVAKIGPLDTVDKKQVTIKDVAFANVSGTISEELKWNAVEAVIAASVFIVLYLAIRFSIGGLKEGLKYGVCAVIALLHDVLVLWGAFALLGYFFGWQIDSLFVTAMLTVIGFSVHDTIIVFDRVRENLQHRLKGETFSDLTDRSIDQTIGRSIRTSLTVVMTLLALFFLGGNIVHQFAGALLIGIISGTYSSIFNASVLLVMVKRNEVVPPELPPTVSVPAGPALETLQARAARGALPERPQIAPVGTPPKVSQTGLDAGVEKAIVTAQEPVKDVEEEIENQAEYGVDNTNSKIYSAATDSSVDQTPGPSRPSTTAPRRQPMRKRRM